MIKQYQQFKRVLKVFIWVCDNPVETFRILEKHIEVEEFRKAFKSTAKDIYFKVWN